MTVVKRPRVEHHGRVTPGKGRRARRLGEVRRRALVAQQRSREALARQIEGTAQPIHCRWCSGEVEVVDRGEGKGRRVNVQHTATCRAALPPRG